MKENNIEELIDGFLRNKLTEAEEVRLKQIVASDPEAATLLKESQETYRYIIHLRYKNIRSQLQQFDQRREITNKPLWIKKIMVAASLILIALLGSYWIISYSFSPHIVAKKYFETIPAQTLKPELFSYLTAAENFFIEENFQSAGKIYLASGDMIHVNYVQHVRWNYLMCKLAVEGPSEQWKKEMLTFISNADEDFKIKAYDVLRIYNSVFYRLITTITAPEITPIKPRLI